MSIKTIWSSYSSICLPSDQTFFPPGPAKGQIYNTLNCLVFFPLLSSGPSWQLPTHQCLQRAGTSTRGRAWAEQLTTWVSWAHSPDSLAVGNAGSWLGSLPFSFWQQLSGGGGGGRHCWSIQRQKRGQRRLCLFLQTYPREKKKVSAYVWSPLNIWQGEGFFSESIKIRDNNFI